MSIPVHELRELYPTPVVSRYIPIPGEEDAYCVGGALCLAHDYGTEWCTDAHFPDEGELAEVLQDLNPTLDETTATSLAVRIVTANDCEHFEEAWDLAEHALTVSGTA